MTDQPTPRAPEPGRCSCGNRFDGDNLCMLSACQMEGLSPEPSAPDALQGDVRAAVSNAYYEARNDGQTMEQAADRAAAAVMDALRRSGLVK